MKDYRETCKNYANLYHNKLTGKKVSPKIENDITECEQKLDLVNLVIIRHQIETEVLFYKLLFKY